MNPQSIERWAALLARAGNIRLEYRTHETTFVLDAAGGKTQAPAAGAMAAASPATPAHAGKDGCVKSPAFGIFHLAHPLRASARLQAADAVQAGQILGFLEASGMFSTVVAPASGVFREVLAQDGEFVNYGTPLFRLGP